MKDIDIIKANYEMGDFENLPLWENVNKVMEEVDKITKSLLDKDIISNFGFNIGDNVLKLHINTSNLMINCNRLEQIISGEKDTEITTIRDIEKKKYKSKEDLDKLSEQGMFKNWTRISNINAEYWFLYKPSNKLQESKKRILSELIDDDELVQQNLDAAKQYNFESLISQIKNFVQTEFDNKYFSQYGVKFLEDSNVAIGDDIEIEGGTSNAINKEDFICITLSYESDKKISKNMMPLVIESSQEVVNSIKRSKMFDTNDIDVYDIITHYRESIEDYNQPFKMYVLIRIPNLQNNIR